MCVFWFFYIFVVRCVRAVGFWSTECGIELKGVICRFSWKVYYKIFYIVFFFWGNLEFWYDRDNNGKVYKWERGWEINFYGSKLLKRGDCLW